MSREEIGNPTPWYKRCEVWLAIPSAILDSLIIWRIAGEPPLYFLLAIGVIGLVLAVVVILGVIAGDHLPPRSGAKAKRWVIAGLLGLTLLAIGLFIWFVVPRRDYSRYGFERPWYDLKTTGTMGWVPNLDPETRGISSVELSVGKACAGRYSLKAIADLDRDRPSMRSGETYVKRTQLEDMKDKTITACVYAPSPAGGDPRSPNGFQLFVKDQDFKNHYSAWLDIAGFTDTWLELELTPGVEVPGDVMDPEFDPTKVMLVGVKIGIGGEAEEGTVYQGPIYIDAVNW